MPCTEMRLEAVPELGYFPSNQPPRGEVCVRGPALFSGYFGNEELTREALGEGALGGEGGARAGAED